MSLFRNILLCLISGLLASCAGLPSPDGHGSGPATVPLEATVRPELARHFAGLDGTFVLLDPAGGRIVRHNPRRAAVRYHPASTFKIPNTLIALETGVASGSGHTLAWDAKRDPPQPWWPAAWRRDHDLSSALANSVVWYYQALARGIGEERMQEYVSRFAYGNENIGGEIDRFWLTGDLRVSADEQVAFLERWHSGRLGVSARTTRIARDALVLEETPRYRLSGKTGWVGLGEPAGQIGWLVGTLERGGRVYFYALNIDIAKPAAASRRLPIVKAIFADLDLL